MHDFIEPAGWQEYFDHHDEFKREHEPHTAEQIAKIDWQGKRVLEIGPGQGYEAEQIIRAGGRYNAIDLTPESIDRLKRRFALKSLPYENLTVMGAEAIDAADESFDIVFTHGVIHHSPQIRKVVMEIHRILRPGGKLIAMVYHRNSLNYMVSIQIVRRLGIFLLFLPGFARIISAMTGENRLRIMKHRQNLRSAGLGYLRMDNFIHKATDGPDNVFSAVFTEDEMRDICTAFREYSASKHFLNERHFPVLRTLLPERFKQQLAACYGWHLWIDASK
ncbi:MAG TPA: class I SAM-dependent methyltransferase [Candidatus Aquilonibacter sp.]|nr:class I SAM-dependent methyltransferase [Candidatus Aquilonibacter sp.]